MLAETKKVDLLSIVKNPLNQQKMKDKAVRRKETKSLLQDHNKKGRLQFAATILIFLFLKLNNLVMMIIYVSARFHPDFSKQMPEHCV